VFDHFIKITDGLVRVNEENKIELRQARTSHSGSPT
jgi:hypothetical protein